MKTIFFRPRVVSLLTQSVERNARETIVTTRMNERSEELECTPSLKLEYSQSTVRDSAMNQKMLLMAEDV